MADKLYNTSEYKLWLAELKDKIRSSQVKAALKVNIELLALCWELGASITQRQAQANWGDKVITQLSEDLSKEFTDIKGFSVTNLKYIKRWFQFYSAIGQQPVDQINYMHLTKLPEFLSAIPWGHHIQIISKTANTDEAHFLHCRND